jgi:hypothetical protein
MMHRRGNGGKFRGGNRKFQSDGTYQQDGKLEISKIENNRFSLDFLFL